MLCDLCLKYVTVSKVIDIFTLVIFFLCLPFPKGQFYSGQVIGEENVKKQQLFLLFKFLILSFQFRVRSDLWKSGKDKPEKSCMIFTQFPIMSASHESMGQRWKTKKLMQILNKLWTLFRFYQFFFPTDAFFLYPDPIPDTTLLLVVPCLQSTLICYCRCFSQP